MKTSSKWKQFGGRAVVGGYEVRWKGDGHLLAWSCEAAPLVIPPREGTTGGMLNWAFWKGHVEGEEGVLSYSQFKMTYMQH